MDKTKEIEKWVKLAEGEIARSKRDKENKMAYYIDAAYALMQAAILEEKKEK